MDLKQVEYIIQIAKENNITRAAEKLFITQSALNQQLLKLEKELGTPLFHRSRTDWRLTDAGEIYIKNAYELIRIKNETYNSIYDIANVKKGSLSIGFTPGRGISMFTTVYPIFHKRYPNITVTPLEMSGKQQLSSISKGELDIGFLTASKIERPNIRSFEICDEDIVLSVPKNYLLPRIKEVLKENSSDTPFRVVDITEFRQEPFVLIYKESSLRTLIDHIFQSAGIIPKILFETSDNNAIVSMIKSGLCCGIIPYYYAKKELDNIACFYLTGYPKWRVYACCHSSNYLSNAAKYFIELATSFWQDNNKHNCLTTSNSE